jgi:hypothetical protein
VIQIAFFNVIPTVFYLFSTILVFALATHILHWRGAVLAFAGLALCAYMEAIGHEWHVGVLTVSQHLRDQHWADPVVWAEHRAWGMTVFAWFGLVTLVGLITGRFTGPWRFRE